MPFAALVVLAFGLGMVLKKDASRQTYALFFIGAVIATLYFMR